MYSLYLQKKDNASTDSKYFFSLLLQKKMSIDYNSANLKIDAITLSWVIPSTTPQSFLGTVSINCE